MKIIIFGGFLGSGKTTIVSRFIQTIEEKNAGTIAVVENEIGEFGIDDLVLGYADVKVIPLLGGCVCCQISGSLIEALQKIEQQINPDWALIELTGLAIPSAVKEILIRYLPDCSDILGICVVDASRWDALNQITPLLIQQLGEMDCIIINKSDINPETKHITEVVQQKLTHSLNIVMAATSAQGQDELELVYDLANKRGGTQ